MKGAICVRAIVHKQPSSSAAGPRARQRELPMTRITLALAAVLATSAAALAATEEELKAKCLASDPNASFVMDGANGQPECKHPGPSPARATPAATAQEPAAPPSAPSKAAHTFEFEGKTWTVVAGPPQAVSAVHMTAGAHNACPTLKVKLEPSKKGPSMTKEQKFRGDKRWHVVCAQ